MKNRFMNEMRYLAGLTPIMESSEFQEEELTEDERIALAEATTSINTKLRDAEVSFLRNVSLLSRKELRKEYPGLKVEPSVTPPMGGGGTIGGVQFVGDNWQIDIILSRKGDKWELWKRGTTTVGRSTPIEITDKAKVDDLKPDWIAMAVSALYGGLVERAAKKAS
jgi:hypothetical protein